MNKTMTPIDLAAQVYDREHCPRTFMEDLTLHLINGYVHSTPESFMIGRKVLSSAPHELIVNPAHVFDEADCWHCYLVAGDMAQAFGFLPYYLPLMSFERKNKLRIYNLNSLRHSVLSKAMG